MLIWGEGVNAEPDGLGHLYKKKRYAPGEKVPQSARLAGGVGGSEGIWAVPK